MFILSLKNSHFFYLRSNAVGYVITKVVNEAMKFETHEEAENEIENNKHLDAAKWAVVEIKQP